MLFWIESRDQLVMWGINIFVGLIHTQHLSLKFLRRISLRISAENDAGSFDVNTCTKTKALQILRTILQFVFTWV